jgi:hypothetical protein
MIRIKVNPFRARNELIPVERLSVKDQPDANDARSRENACFDARAPLIELGQAAAEVADAGDAGPMRTGSALLVAQLNCGCMSSPG